ncbi:MAG: prepilin-type N-terminal cleavage/methylation domain-containing protein [Coxiellaceae bacterium]|nr:prepilin-type N-terminal cleavage/methylation domain-containing protein [Coxiellaceae bacterium]
MNIINKTKQAGFTLVELIIVIVILGILSAFAIPKFIDVAADARKATVDGLTGALRSAANVGYSMGKVKGISDAAVTMGGGDVTLANGYPAGTAAGIGAAISGLSGFSSSYSGTTATFQATGATTATECQVTYVGSTAADVPPVITATTTGC